MEKRSEKLLKLLNELNVDGIFLTDLYNLRYFAGFTGTTGVALATKKGNFLQLCPHHLTSFLLLLY